MMIKNFKQICNNNLEFKNERASPCKTTGSLFFLQLEFDNVSNDSDG